MLEDPGDNAGQDCLALAHLVDEDLPEGMNLDLVAILQIFQAGEGTGSVEGIPNRRRENRVAAPDEIVLDP